MQCLILRCFFGVVPFPLTGLVPAVGLHLVIPFVRTLAFLGVGPVGCNRWFLVAGIDGHAFGGRCWWSCSWSHKGSMKNWEKVELWTIFMRWLWRKLRYVNLHPVTAAGSESSRMIEINPLSGQLFMNGIDPTPTNNRSIGIKQKYLLEVVVSVALAGRGARAAVESDWLHFSSLLCLHWRIAPGPSSRWHRKCKKMLEHVTSKRLICSFMRGIAPNKLVRIWSLGLIQKIWVIWGRRRLSRWQTGCVAW